MITPADKFLIDTDETTNVTVSLVSADDTEGATIALSRGDARMLASILNSAANTVGEENSVTLESKAV